MLAVCGVALAMVTAVAAQTVKEGVGTVVRIKGAARFSTGNDVWQTLMVGMVLKPGTIVQTASNSVVDIVLGEAQAVDQKRPVGEMLYYQPETDRDAVAWLFEDSVLAIDKLTTTETGVDVVKETADKSISIGDAFLAWSGNCRRLLITKSKCPMVSRAFAGPFT